MGSSREVWGLCPQLGVPPLHPILSLVTIATLVVVFLNPLRIPDKTAIGLRNGEC